MRSTNRVELYFKDAIERELLKFEVERGDDDAWLTVYYKENLGAMPSVDGSRWSLLCAQQLSGYRTPLELCNRITLMLTEKCRSTQQDVNILMKERS